MAHSQEVATDLQKAVGSRPFVGFNWANGSLVNVSVTFEGIPVQTSTARIAELSRQSIAKHFQQTPKQVVIGFALKTD